MPRKKTAVAEVPASTEQESSFNPAEFDPSMQEQVGDIVHGEGEAPRSEPTTTHAEAVGRKPRYNDQGKSDYVAGIKLLEHQNPYLSIIRFNEKPSLEVRAKMRASGFDWHQGNEEWHRRINFETRAQDRLSAERTFDEVSKMVRAERGIEHSVGIAG